MTNLPLGRQSDIVVQELETETLIYDLKTDKAFCLNESSTLVWQMCDGAHSIEQISHSLSRKLNAPVTEEFVWLALDQFKRDGMLENNDEIEIDFNGLNRRQIIKKAGIASLAALPIVASIVAPSAAMAASGCVNPGGLGPNVNLGGSGGAGMCSTPGAADGTCTTNLGMFCCTGMAFATQCNDAGPGPSLGFYSVGCSCS